MQPKSKIATPAVRSSTARHDPWWVRSSVAHRLSLTVGVLIVIPIVHVFWQAFRDGYQAYFHNSLRRCRHTSHAVLLTMIVAPVAVAFNVVFGVAAAWAIARFRFPGRTLLTRR